MQEQIRELYQKLCNQNIEILEEKKANVREEKISNVKSIAKSKAIHIILEIGSIIVFIIFLNIILNVIFDIYKSNDYEKGIGFTSFMLNIFGPAVLIIGFISLIYQIVIRPIRSIQRNYFVNISEDSKEEYNDIFCEKICGPIIEYIIPNSQYNHNSGIPQELYESMGFSNKHDKFISTDNIKLNNNGNLIISKVHTLFKDGGASGYWYATMFCGIASINAISFNIPCSIKIRNRALGSLKLKNPVQLNNDEFNQYYEIETDNIQLLNKYISNKILDYLVALAKNNQCIEINISQNYMYIRLHNSNFLNFKANDKYNEEKIIDDCNSIITVINTNDFIINELKSNNIY
jgi:hypothetical protein